MEMEQRKLSVAASPHITSGSSTRKIMLGVVVALLPTLVAAAIIFGPGVLLLTGICVVACVGFEALYCVLLKKPLPIGDCSAIVTGLILAFNLPPGFPIWMAIIGCFVAIFIAKQLFGGIGFNFANPALVGRMVLQLSFTGAMVRWVFPMTQGGVDALASATPLALDLNQVPLIDALLGTHGGTLGETCAITLIIGGLFLIFTKIIKPTIPVIYIGGTFIFKFLLLFGSAAAEGGFSAALASAGPIAYESLTYILVGGLLLGAFFMATDYTTSPYTQKGQVIFAIGLVILTVAMREWSNMNEGVSYSILFMSLLVPYINSGTRKRPLGVSKEALKAAKGKGAD